MSTARACLEFIAFAALVSVIMAITITVLVEGLDKAW